MDQDVPDVQRVIEQDNREQYVERSRQSRRMEQSEPAPLHDTRERLNQRALQQIDRCGSQAGEYQISRKAAKLRLVLLPERPPALERREHHECSADYQWGEPADVAHDGSARAGPRSDAAPDRAASTDSASPASLTTNGAVA